MSSRRFPAVFMRGGTSRALMFHRRDLPNKRDECDAIFFAAMGSPDPNGRQLNGMGGGVSSLSKVCIVGAPSRPDADVDYTFVQVSVKDGKADYGGNCGNMSSAVGPFAVDEGLVGTTDGPALVRIHNTNTGKLIHSSFPVLSGRAVTHGDFAIPGVAGTGAAIRLDFIEPGGATTGKLLPTGAARDRLNVPGVGELSVSMVDAANACVFVKAGDLGLRGNELPDFLETSPRVLETLAAIRADASVAMGIASTASEATVKPLVPFVAIVSQAQDSATMTGEPVLAQDMDLTVRVISNGQPHRAIPLTIALCTSVAAAIDGTVVAEVAKARCGMRIGTPAGILAASARIARENGHWRAASGTFFRTARRLFDGNVYC